MTGIEWIIKDNIWKSEKALAKAIEQYVSKLLLEKDVYWSGSNKKLHKEISELKKGLK